MDKCFIIYIVLTITSGLFAAILCNDLGENDLIEKLLQNYTPMVRPVKSPNETVQVGLSMSVIKLQEVNTKNQFIAVLGWVNTYWYDLKMQWEPDEYNGLDYVSIPAPNLWLPTYVLANSASEYLYNEFWYSLFKVQVFSNGLHKWSPGGIFKADCPIDVHFFPFDEQICQFRFENWVYMGDKVNLTFTANANDNFFKYYTVENGQWKIIDSAIFRQDKYFSGEKPYPRVHFGVHLRRKSLFYVTNIILLSLLLAVLVLFIFKLPAESGERISMGVTLLLAFSVFILMINDNIPETSSAVPIIIIYLISFMGLTALGICESVFILFCYHHNGKYPPPKKIKNLIFRISKVLSAEKGKGLIGKECGKNRIELKQRKQENKANHGSINSTNDAECDNQITSEDNCECNDNDTYAYIHEWQDLSRQIDIICFWLFLAMFLILVVVLLVFLPVSFSDKNIEKAVKYWSQT